MPDADGRFLAAVDADEADAGDLGNFLREAGVGEVLDLRERHAGGGEGEGHDRRIGGIDLAVDGRVGEVGGEIGAGGVDGLLHFLLGDVDVEGEGELEGDDGAAVGAGGGHLLQAGDLAELALERGGDGGGHDLGAGAGVEGDDLHGRVIDLGQRGDGELGVADKAGEEDRRHEEGGGDGPQDEGAGGAHGAS
jgi:hypothetical protein